MRKGSRHWGLKCWGLHAPRRARQQPIGNPAWGPGRLLLWPEVEDPGRGWCGGGRQALDLGSSLPSKPHLQVISEKSLRSPRAHFRCFSLSCCLSFTYRGHISWSRPRTLRQTTPSPAWVSGHSLMEDWILFSHLLRFLLTTFVIQTIIITVDHHGCKYYNNYDLPLLLLLGNTDSMITIHTRCLDYRRELQRSPQNTYKHTDASEPLLVPFLEMNAHRVSKFPSRVLEWPFWQQRLGEGISACPSL